MTMDQIYLLIEIISATIGIIGGIGGIVFGIIQLIKNMKNKSASDNWITIMEIAKSAMESAEKSRLSGAEKKSAVLDAVQAGCAAAGIVFTDAYKKQLNDWIDQMVAFANSFDKTRKKVKK